MRASNDAKRITRENPIVRSWRRGSESNRRTRLCRLSVRFKKHIVTGYSHSSCHSETQGRCVNHSCHVIRDSPLPPHTAHRARRDAFEITICDLKLQRRHAAPFLDVSNRLESTRCKFAGSQSRRSTNQVSRTLAKVERCPARKERLSFYDNFLDYLCCARSVMNDSNAFAGNDHHDIEVLPRSCFRVGRSETPERPCGLGFAVRPLFSELVGSDPEGEFLRPRHST